MLALIPVRDGVVPAGALEVAAECGYRSLVIGTGTAAAAAALGGEVAACETDQHRPAAWAIALAEVLKAEPLIVLPASPDGRDLAPRLAATLERPLLAGAVSVTPGEITIALGGGTSMSTVTTPAACVATLQPGVRGVEPPPPVAHVTSIQLDLAETRVADPRVLQILDPDPSTIDLAEAPRIVGGGAGLRGPDQFRELAQLGELLGASVGATRVITDRGWVGHERQIGTTGVVVDPRLYLAFGISGAVQHTSGLGTPDHIISVNIDAHCPMMQLADLAVVADANVVLDELIDALRAGDHAGAGSAHGG
ncbi:MAG: mycofactocin-associated electron transfer flavoprotein alpha subunit [Ilumatobacteraceae bacterium]